jgi:hypothetical protein
MTEKSIDIIMLQNIQAEQRKTNERLDTIDKRVYALGQEVGQIKGSIPKPAKNPWWLTTIVAPLVVAVSVAIVATVINLLVRVSRIEGDFHDNAGFIAGLRLQQNATDPVSPQNVADVQHVLETAKKKRFKIPPDVVQTTGVKFVQAAHTNPDAWNAALAFLEYRSFENTVKLNSEPQPLQQINAHYDVLAIGPMGSAFTVPPTVPQDEGAKMYLLDKTNRNANNPLGPSFLVLEDATYQLDSLYMRRVIFRNSRIVYKGGPLVLDDVTFVNCTFEIPQQPNGLNFATVFLEPKPSMSFTADAERLSVVLQP